ncbi:MAG: TraX family protein [Oscillospiraceae bacterium]|nr:TraX family protein [Oscillospiraceae bacterium]
MSASALKLLGLLLMLSDHLFHFSPGTAPLWSTWLGRLSAPLFFFCMAQGVLHTRSPGRYLLRLYSASLLMGLGNLLLPRLLHSGQSIPCNIFSTLFLGAALCALARTALQDPAAALRPAGAFLLLEFLSPALIYVLPKSWEPAVALLLPTPSTVEGGLPFVLLGPLLFLCAGSRSRLAVGFLLFSSGFLLPALSLVPAQGIEALLSPGSCQWMMALALPLLLLYNGRPGPRLKWLFYAVYPLHIWLFFTLSAVF